MKREPSRRRKAASRRLPLKPPPRAVPPASDPPRPSENFVRILLGRDLIRPRRLFSKPLAASAPPRRRFSPIKFVWEKIYSSFSPSPALHLFLLYHDSPLTQRTTFYLFFSPVALSIYWLSAGVRISA